MTKYRIYPFIILFALVASIILPNYYKDIFGKKLNSTRINYSPVSEEFVKSTFITGKKRKTIYSNVDETKIFKDFEEYAQQLPFMYIYNLLKNDTFPEKFISYKQNQRLTRTETGYLNLKAAMVNINGVPLFALMESKPKYSLEFPDDLFRLGKDGITFINLQENKTDTKKSKEYNEAFLKQGAVFPLKDAYGNPTTMKRFDEGYFITDSKNQIFQLKRVHDKPQVTKVSGDYKAKFLQIKENARREFFGYAVNDKNEVSFLMYDDHEFVKLPIKDYDYRTHNVYLYRTPINRSFRVEHIDYDKKEKVIDTYVTNLDYELKAQNHYTISLKGSKLYEGVKSLIFPYKLSIVRGNMQNTNFKLRDISWVSFLFYLIIAGAYLLYIRKTNRDEKEHILNTVLIVVTGVYSIIPLLIFGKFLGLKKVKNEKN